MSLWEEPYLVAFIMIALSFIWCFWTVYKMKKSFEDRGGSYQPVIDILTPDFLKLKK